MVKRYCHGMDMIFMIFYAMIQEHNRISIIALIPMISVSYCMSIIATFSTSCCACIMAIKSLVSCSYIIVLNMSIMPHIMAIESLVSSEGVIPKGTTRDWIYFSLLDRVYYGGVSRKIFIPNFLAETKRRREEVIRSTRS